MHFSNSFVYLIAIVLIMASLTVSAYENEEEKHLVSESNALPIGSAMRRRRIDKAARKRDVKNTLSNKEGTNTNNLCGHCAVADN
ncbi:uncharacterized protein EV154DRAFT_494886, partial [Mucor mucedo]|uniref:uncharacterized protein n=1 Tax=Mucor mucedo TaxID=29922 RepID=UPI00221E69DE